MISVIVIARNAESTIFLALLSLLISLRKCDEVLLLLDACSDNTEMKARRLTDKRIKIFSTSEPLGRSGGRNFLIEKAKGEIIGVLDADDIALPWRFFLARKLLRKHDAVFGTAIVFGKSLKFVPFLPQPMRSIHPRMMAIECLGRNPLVHSSATFKKSALGAETAYRDSEAEEYDLWLRMLNSDLRLYRSALPVVLYRMHPNQASQQPGFIERAQNCSLVMNQQKKLARKIGLQLETIDSIRCVALEQVSQSSHLARLEVLGLGGLKNLISRRSKRPYPNSI
jgi:glycosyltransferase involved in cell wall biosynthesis